jgi:hypothetical protein
MLDMSTTAFDSQQLHYVLRGMRKTCPRRFLVSPRLPITIWLLAKFCGLLSLSHRDQVVKAALATGVYGLMRGGEYLAKSLRPNPLTRGDTCWYDDRVVLRLRDSKTDVFHRGVEVTLWRNGSVSCPYALIKAAWDLAPLKFASAALFQEGDGSPLSYGTMQSAIKRLAVLAGLDPASFSTHSGRIGGATSLALLGFPEHMIKELGRWRSLSYQLYTRTSAAQFRAIAAALGEECNRASLIGMFGGLTAKQACAMGWDDLSDVARFAIRPGGMLAARLNAQ